VSDGQLRCAPCQSEWVRRYYHRNQERRLKQRRSYIKRTYGATLEHLEELLAFQGDACAICRTPWQECDKSHGRHNDGTFLQQLEVDHNHETGRLRGLLCEDCNIAIGKLYDDVDSCRRAADYLRRAREA